MIGQKHIGQTRRALIKTRANKRFEEYKNIKVIIYNLEKNGECRFSTDIVSKSTIKKLTTLLPEHKTWLYGHHMKISII